MAGQIVTRGLGVPKIGSISCYGMTIGAILASEFRDRFSAILKIGKDPDLKLKVGRLLEAPDLKLER